MAKDQKSNINIKKIKNLSNNIQKNMDDIYNLTYFNTNNNNNDLELIRKNIDNSIDSIITKNTESIGVTSISNLYTRLTNEQNNPNTIKNIENYFSDDNIANSLFTNYTQQRWIRDLDAEIDMICKYMPKLQEALDTKSDNVLTADSFGRDFIKVSTDKNSEGEREIFDERIKGLKRKYRLIDLFEKVYNRASKYGEQFVYIVPYKKAFSKLLNTQVNNITNNISAGSRFGNNRSLTIKAESCTITIDNNTSNIKISSIKEDNLQQELKKYFNENFSIQVDNDSRCIKSILEQENIKHNKMSKTIKDDIEFDTFKDYDKTSADGTIDINTYSEKDFNTNGCIVRTLKRDKVIPIYIEDICLGYYYFEFNSAPEDYGYADITDPILTVKRASQSGSVTSAGYESYNDILKYLTSQISSMIDKNFINANPDLNKDIYMVLKHNNIFNGEGIQGMKITFIPPEDMVHVRFNEDEDSHRGVSDLANALLPAKLYASLYITNTIGILTRGQDKRVYYVKQTVDTNISQTLLNTINQIKKSNFGLREINSIGQILNITGQYNDYFIPTSQSGDSPIQFEVMQGQDINPQTDLMNMLEEMAINSTDVPLELIQARQSMDYATQYVMSNSKFLKKVFKRQAITNEFFGDIMTKIYNYEFDTSEIVTFCLPSPMFLQTSNISQLLDTASTYIETISRFCIPDDENQEVKQIFNRNMLKSLMHSHIDSSDIADQYELAKLEFKKNQMIKNEE